MSPEEFLISIAEILKKLNIDYFITGGFAVSVWGRPRATFDIDIIIKLRESKIPLLVNSLKLLSKAGYIEEEAIKDALRHKGEFNFIHPETGLKVDFWIAKEDLVSKNEFARRIPKKIKGQLIYFVSPEDLILSKLRWFKESESTRHLEDVGSIFKISKVDSKYIRKQAKTQSTGEILKKIQKDI